MEILWFALVVLVVALLLTPVLQRRSLRRRRQRLIRTIEQQRGSRVVTLIHRQEIVSLLGIPLTRFINIEDAERVLRAIRLTPDEMPVDLVLHTPGGLVLPSDQIAFALRRRSGRVTVIVPHYAMSGGTLVALAADEILMDPDAVLGPVDPQLGSVQRGYYPAASILRALEQPNPNRDDETLILGDMAGKAIAQAREAVRDLMAEGHAEEEAERIATTLSDGRWTHDFPIRLERARDLGLPVREGIPAAVYDLMSLYPQAAQRRPSVEFIPVPYPEPGRPPGHERTG
jgi:ClpP class serine protease